MEMKRTIIISIILLLAKCSFAQDKSVITIPLDKGNLTFQYYEKDGIKIPDGLMEYASDGYSEKGENKDGEKEGLWIAESRLGKKLVRIKYNYNDGLLEGKTTFSSYSINPSTKKEQLESEEEYNFHKGHLFGENKIVFSDTLYCNFDEKGYRVGTWKIVNKSETAVAEYIGNEKSDIANEYILDILGNKTIPKYSKFNLTASTPLILFYDKIRYLPFGLRKDRPNLPSLTKAKYGYREASQSIEKSEQKENFK